VTVVTFNYPLQANPENISYDGIFISNGPGDPTMCTETIESLRVTLTTHRITPPTDPHPPQWAINLESPKPIFGICLGELRSQVALPFSR
jgi:carbamoylphosphate synthase small subunit